MLVSQHRNHSIGVQPGGDNHLLAGGRDRLGFCSGRLVHLLVGRPPLQLFLEPGVGNNGEPPAAAVKGTLSEDCGVSTAGTYVGRKGGDPLRWYLERFVWSIPEPG